MIDIVKDWFYLYIFKHSFWDYLILLLSITVPFSSINTLVGGGDVEKGLIGNFLQFIGFVVIEDEDQPFRAASIVLIALVENVPQFCIIVKEMIKFRNSVMFIQAGNSVFALCMIYKVAAPYLGN